jgi:hypothetical protein
MIEHEMTHIFKVDRVKYELEIHLYSKTENYFISYDPIPTPEVRKELDEKVLKHVEHWWIQRNLKAHRILQY